MFCIQQIGNKGNSGGTGMCNIVEPEEVYVLNANVPGNLPANVWDSTNKHEDVTKQCLDGCESTHAPAMRI